LAHQTAEALRRGGNAARLLPLATIDAAMLAGESHVLFVVSTTGEGDAPDTAIAFARQVLGTSANLSGMSYGLLALGDRDYEDFCGFGHALDHWLRASDAMPLFDLVEVDNGDDGALRHWQHHLGRLCNDVDMPDWQVPDYATWTLRERRLLNPGSAGEPCFHLALAPVDAVAWRAGDIAEVGPRHARAEIDAWLVASGHDGEALVGEKAERLAGVLGRCHLPAAADVRGLAPARWVPSLVPLPHREYSIASLPADGLLELLVRRACRDDGSTGFGSGWLTVHAGIGEDVALRIRTNPNFHAPVDDRPLILIGNGTGLAGLRALLKQRMIAGHRRNWLLFGERNAARDAFHGDELTAWAADGFIEVLDMVWSRDQSERRYVQHRLRERSGMLGEWIDAGAAIYVCGSLVGMAPGVDAALREMLGERKVDLLMATSRYRRDVY
jgi:sulfite reductase (NADPH) flavoprotein alpha-component